MNQFWFIIDITRGRDLSFYSESSRRKWKQIFYSNYHNRSQCCIWDESASYPSVGYSPLPKARKGQRVKYISTYELQINRRQDENCEVSTSWTAPYVYRHKGSVMGQSHKSGLSVTWSHPYWLKSCTKPQKHSKNTKSRYEMLSFDSGPNDSEESDEE